MESSSNNQNVLNNNQNVLNNNQNFTITHFVETALDLLEFNFILKDEDKQMLSKQIRYYEIALFTLLGINVASIEETDNNKKFNLTCLVIGLKNRIFSDIQTQILKKMIAKKMHFMKRFQEDFNNLNPKNQADKRNFEAKEEKINEEYFFLMLLSNVFDKARSTSTNKIE